MLREVASHEVEAEELSRDRLLPLLDDEVVEPMDGMDQGRFRREKEDDDDEAAIEVVEADAEDKVEDIDGWSALRGCGGADASEADVLVAAGAAAAARFLAPFPKNACIDCCAPENSGIHLLHNGGGCRVASSHRESVLISA